jgi:hypothetical protein
LRFFAHEKGVAKDARIFTKLFSGFNTNKSKVSSAVIKFLRKHRYMTCPNAQALKQYDSNRTTLYHKVIFLDWLSVLCVWQNSTHTQNHPKKLSDHFHFCKDKKRENQSIPEMLFLYPKVCKDHSSNHKLFKIMLP